MTNDSKPYIQFSSIDPSWITPDNPLGYDIPWMRLDTPAGITAFEVQLEPLLGNIAGLLCWQPQGINVPREGTLQYSANFDPPCWPPGPAQNIPTLISFCAANNIRFGLLCQPSRMNVMLNAAQNQVVDVNPNDPAQMAIMQTRFANCTAAGVNAYYADSFGNLLSDAMLAKALRGWLGPDVPVFCEMTSDLVIGAGMDVYTEVLDGTGATQWYSAQQIQLMRLLNPSVKILAHVASGSFSSIMSGAQAAAVGMTPLINIADVNALAICEQFNAAMVG
jgi:hypothetical protein